MAARVLGSTVGFVQSGRQETETGVGEGRVVGFWRGGLIRVDWGFEGFEGFEGRAEGGGHEVDLRSEK